MVKRTIHFFIPLLFWTAFSEAQIQSALNRIDGMTCSACSYTTERSLRTLDFVQDVELDLNNNKVKITFVKGRSIDMDKLSQKVRDAAFSVGSLILIVELLKDQKIQTDSCMEIDQLVFHFLAVKEQLIHQTISLILIGKNFMDRKEYKKWHRINKNKCSGHGIQKEYYVTL
jgi:copper chaperone CopZ